MATDVFELPLNYSTGLSALRNGGYLDGEGDERSVYDFVKVATGAANAGTNYITYTRNGEAVGINHFTGKLVKSATNLPAYGPTGIQIGPSITNVLSNSGMSVDGGSGIPANFTLVDSAAIATAKAIVNSGLGESDKAFDITINNSTGSTQTVTLYQSTTGSTGQSWTSQARVKVISSTGSVTAELRTNDFTNSQAQATAVNMATTGYWRLFGVTLTLLANSTDLRWVFTVTLNAGATARFTVTNAMLSQTAWTPHYVPSVTGPTTRAADTIDITRIYDGAGLWSLDFSPQAPTLTTTQYLFSWYNGANGHSLFLRNPSELVWQRDVGGVTTDLVVSLAPHAFGNIYRAFLSYKDLGGGSWSRSLVALLPSGSFVFQTATDAGPLGLLTSTLKLGRNNSNANLYDGYIGSVRKWAFNTTNSVKRVYSAWPL